jgi:pseudouridine synthase
LLLTNDGASAHALLHPSFEVVRTYRVSVDGVPDAATLRRLREGVLVEGRRTAPCRITIDQRERDRSVLVMELIEGRRRQIRSMLDAVGHRVRRLVRTGFGPLTLRGLRPGEHRQLERGEVRALRELVRAAGDTNRQQRR